MAKVKVEFSEFKSYLISNLGMMYVLGAQGHKFVDLLDKICVMEKNEINLVNNVLTLLEKKLKAGVDINTLLAFDCSGLGMKWLIDNGIFKYDMTAKDMYNSIPQKVESLNSVRAGDFVFTESLGHVGYAIGDDSVIEARGTAYGVVLTDLYKREWTKIARPDWWIDVEKPVLRRELYLTDPLMKGDDVEDCQKLLIEKKYNPGKVDGVFGKATKIAVQNFQTDSKLNVNRLGVVGKKTALALGFIWEG
jgi:hypothetical protein